MARLPRLVIAGAAHCVVQQGLAGRPVFVDAQDRDSYAAALLAAAAAEQCSLHAWALLEAEVRLVVTPAAAPALARLLQGVGRRYVSAYHRRHATSGTLWSGRYRSAVLEPGSPVLDALRWVDGASATPGWTSAGHRTGGWALAGVVDPPEIWQLGNTPFEREAAYQSLLAAGLPEGRAWWLRKAVMGGWAAGSEPFAAAVAAAGERPARPRSAGRKQRA